MTYQPSFVTFIELVRPSSARLFGGEEVFGIDILFVGFAYSFPSVCDRLGVALERSRYLRVALVSMFNCKEDFTLLNW